MYTKMLRNALSRNPTGANGNIQSARWTPLLGKIMHRGAFSAHAQARKFSSNLFEENLTNRTTPA